MDMFCYQCEQAYQGKGCNQKGVCGKEPDAAVLMDVIIHQLKGLAYLAHQLRQKGVVKSEWNRFTLETLFVTVTNVNFDSNRLVTFIKETRKWTQDALAVYQQKINVVTDGLPESVRFVPQSHLEGLMGQGQLLSILSDHEDQDVRSCQHLLMYGLKGMAAYAHHAMVLGYEEDEIYAFIHEALTAMTNPANGVQTYVDLLMRCGRVNLRCMEVLDKAHTTRFGHPEPTVVSTAVKKGPAIIISGHDLLDLEELLKQTEGKGISIYTHGEMLPAHGYPGLRKYAHLVGHFGTAWQNQQKEFEKIPAAIYFTTNCIQEPKTSYMDRVFTGSVVGWPGVAHIEGRDFTPVIQKALALPGFSDKPGKKLLTGCGRNAVLSLADKVVGAVKAGEIRHFFLIGGCDGAKPGRNYFTEVARRVPKDCVILTLACGKFRFNDLEFGTVAGIPRLLDVGQCNDAYSAVKIAEALANAFSCNLGDLPLTLIISWYEQKAVAVLLSLLALGIKGIRLGPSLPAFVSPNVLNYLVENFDVKLITTPEKDLQAALVKGVAA